MRADAVGIDGPCQRQGMAIDTLRPMGLAPILLDGGKVQSFEVEGIVRWLYRSRVAIISTYRATDEERGEKERKR
jgi:hypothetical protein